jgi:hypothetical protein
MDRNPSGRMKVLSYLCSIDWMPEAHLKDFGERLICS